MRFLLSKQISEISDPVRSKFAMVVPMIEATLFALNSERIARLGGLAQWTLAHLEASSDATSVGLCQFMRRYPDPRSGLRLRSLARFGVVGVILTATPRRLHYGGEGDRDAEQDHDRRHLADEPGGEPDSHHP